MTYAPATNMRAITPPRLMQAHPERIVGAKDGRQQETTGRAVLVGDSCREIDLNV
jgi:hypothetical protein